jgi:hypothetical protein
MKGPKIPFLYSVFTVHFLGSYLKARIATTEGLILDINFSITGFSVMNRRRGGPNSEIG